MFAASYRAGLRMIERLFVEPCARHTRHTYHGWIDGFLWVIRINGGELVSESDLAGEAK